MLLLKRLVVLLSIFFVAIAIYSYTAGGFVQVLVAGAAAEGPWLDRLRAAVASWGPLAPAVYTLVVVMEVVVAPIPGALLYAPGGAIFGGFAGGTLSLVGNVIGAAICCVLGSMIGERLIGAQAKTSQFGRYRERLADRGLWVVLLLRINPLTSSDLVSYAAGVAGVSPWKVAAGTLIGLAPLCYLQAYFAEQIFTLIPGPLLILAAVVLTGIVLFVALRRSNASAGPAPEPADRLPQEP
jgi:uncharacterized membrane protein YdjX (TVP38/TMEM64 family)